MAVIRILLATFVSFALVLYGAVATGPAHAHDSSGYHGVHMAMDHHHDDDHHGAAHGDPAESDAEPTLSASKQHEAGSHSHAAPQFEPIAAVIVTFVPQTIGPIDFHDPDDLTAIPPGEYPFKPPRIRL